jgi:hypothetical protein
MSEIENEGVKIASNSTVSLLKKSGLLTLFLFGLFMRIFIPIETFVHLADVMMAVAVLGRLFMYVKALNPSLFLPKHDGSPLHLVDKTPRGIPAYDQSALSPLERVISDK